MSEEIHRGVAMDLLTLFRLVIVQGPIRGVRALVPGRVREVLEIPKNNSD